MKRKRNYKKQKGGQQSLVEILKKYETHNDLAHGTDKGTTHAYDTVYEKIFEPYRNNNIKLLEIGLYGGADLLAFNEYFSNSTIYGIDITDSNLMKQLYDHKNIHIYIGDATLQDTVQHFNTTYDIIIEDGSHLPEHQIQHFKDYNKFVNKGGIYIIEDVAESNLENVKAKTTEIANENNFTLEVYDLRKIKNRFDDILLVFKKN
jgi:dihydroneopterin aldolase